MAAEVAATGCGAVVVVMVVVAGVGGVEFGCGVAAGAEGGGEGRDVGVGSLLLCHGSTLTVLVAGWRAGLLVTGCCRLLG